MLSPLFANLFDFLGQISYILSVMDIILRCKDEDINFLNIPEFFGKLEETEPVSKNQEGRVVLFPDRVIKFN
ncbi:TPA: hypothetical protein DCZ32_04540 [Candidatus Uhrbacteria bacterium]|nr:hypothetical protein [Candidatus Uhrbacteria bacterium]